MEINSVEYRYNISTLQISVIIVAIIIIIKVFDVLILSLDKLNAV
jgi:hypothetical protein